MLQESSEAPARAQGAGSQRRPRMLSAVAGCGLRRILRWLDAGRCGPLSWRALCVASWTRLSCPLVAPAALLSANPQAIALP